MNGSWADIHQNRYAGSNWIDKPSIFAETAVMYFPKSGKVLDLGAGQGQDSRFFAERGYEVMSTDFEQKVLDMSADKLPETLAPKVTLRRVDMREKLPFDDASFEAVYAHLALHYFNTQLTEQIFGEIRRILKPGGVLAFLVNSTSDPEYGTGEPIEQDYFHTDGMPKRYFTVRSAAVFTAGFETKLLDNAGESYKDMAKGVHHLVRFVGVKPE